MNRRTIKIIRRYIDKTLKLLFPPRCPQCDRILPYGDRICPECQESIIYEEEPRCMKCGRTMRHEKDPTRAYCRDCEKHPHNYDYGYCLAEYHSIARSIYRMKYQNRRENAAWYGEEIARRLGRQILALHPDVLVPVPLHKKRQRQRGYNQAEDVAGAISRKLGIPVRNDLIIRKINTAPMKRTDDEKMRRNNLKNAFQLRGDVVKYKKILIVDDIYTSGSTIDAVAREFREAGVSGIFFVTVAASHL